MNRRRLYDAIAIACVSTATIWLHYHSVPLGIAANSQGLFVWALSIMIGVLWLAG